MSEKVVLELSVYTDGDWSFNRELFRNYISKYVDIDLFEYTIMSDYTLKIQRVYEGVDNGFKQVSNLIRQFNDSVKGRDYDVKFVKESFSRWLEKIDNCEEMEGYIDGNSEIGIQVTVVNSDSKRIKKIILEDDSELLLDL